MIIDQIKNFPKQFAWEPEIVNAERMNLDVKRPSWQKFVVVGMGGSNLAAGLVKSLRPELDVIIWRDYGLPIMNDEDKQKTLFILSSYSGNTEEVLVALEAAQKEKLNTAVIAAGGKLLEAARAAQLPYIEIPEKNIQPRMAIGYSFLAHLKLMGEDVLASEARDLPNMVASENYEQIGRALAERINGRIPLIYACGSKEALAYNWKVRLNETGKTPAFIGLMPELMHNELAGFEGCLPGGLKNFFVIILRDLDDAPEAASKIDRLEKYFTERRVPFEAISLAEGNKLARIFSSIIIADWTAYYLAGIHGLDPDDMRAIEDFKKVV